jgi:hypothetical protein
MRDKDTGWKAITKDKLLSILNTLPDDTLFSVGEITRNIVVWKGVWPDEEYIGQINLMTDEFDDHTGVVN